jgi:hypothetical protein
MNKPQKKEDNNLTIIERDIIFRKLVQEDTRSQTNYDRIVGMIAYCQYLIQKYQWLEKSKQDNTTYPTDAEVKGIILYYSSEKGDAIESLKKTSELQLKGCIKDFITKETEAMLKKHTRFWNSVCANLVSSFIYSLIIGAIIFSATASMPNTKFSRIIKILFEEVNSK